MGLDRRRVCSVGETDEVTYDFLIAENVSEVQVYTYFKNVSKKGREIGWGRTVRAELPALRSSKPRDSHIFPLETSEMTVDDSRSPERVEKQQAPRTPPQRLDEQQMPKSSPPVKDPGKKK